MTPDFCNYRLEISQQFDVTGQSGAQPPQLWHLSLSPCLLMFFFFVFFLKLCPKRYPIWQKKKLLWLGPHWTIDNNVRRWLFCKGNLCTKRETKKEREAPFACHHSNYTFICLVFVLFILQLRLMNTVYRRGKDDVRWQNSWPLLLFGLYVRLVSGTLYMEQYAKNLRNYEKFESFARQWTCAVLSMWRPFCLPIGMHLNVYFFGWSPHRC